MNKISFIAEDIIVGDELRAAIANSIKDGLDDRINYALERAILQFDIDNEPGDIQLFLDDDRELPIETTLAAMVDNLISRNNDKTYFNFLADEFEKYAKSLRSA